MIIQASHMNHGFMQKLQANKAQGKNLGSASSLLDGSQGSRLGSGLNVDGRTPSQIAMETVAKAVELPGKLPQQAPETVGQTVAGEVIRRMQVEKDAEGQPKDVSSLRKSLGSALDWVTERFGEEAGTAAASMMLSATSGTVDEEAIGDGLLNALKFIDRNFGYAAGDAAIAKFNTGVNRELNDYFDNGRSEVFFAKPAGDAAETSATQDLSARFFARAVQNSDDKGGDPASITEKLLADLKADLDKTGELNDLAAQLEAEFNPAQATLQNAMAAYTQTAVPVEPLFADLSV